LLEDLLALLLLLLLHHLVHALLFELETLDEGRRGAGLDFGLRFYGGWRLWFVLETSIEFLIETT
jgi:hypothetical protein